MEMKTYLFKVVTLCITVSSFGKPALSEPSKPNIVFVLIDDLGFNDFSWRSSDMRDAWPNVNNLVKQGVRVDEYYTHALCTPTRAAFMTGRMPLRQGLQNGVLTPFEHWGVPLNELTLAEKLKAVGYRTYGVGKWHLGYYNNASTPLQRGFDRFYGYYNGREDHFTHKIDGYLDLVDDGHVDASQLNQYSAHLFSEKVESIISSHKKSFPEKPMFLYYAMQNVHEPLQVPAEYKDSKACAHILNPLRRVYCGMARAVDSAIGNLTQQLETKFVDDVLLVISGDNGGLPMAGGSNFPLRGQKTELWEGGVRNNALLYSRTLIPSTLWGTVYTGGFVHVMDWHATFLELAGASNSTGLPTDSVSVWPAIMQNSSSPRTEIALNIESCNGLLQTSNCNYTIGGYAQAAYRQGDYKLLLGVHYDIIIPVLDGASNASAEVDWYGFPTASGGVKFNEAAWLKNGFGQTNWLFNLRDDPSERHNLYDTHPEKVRQIKAKIDALAKQEIFACGSSCPVDKSAQRQASKLGVLIPWVPPNDGALS